ncbi:MAG: anthranilate synthase component I family protein [Chitinophagaceae bacterium]
MNRQFTSFTIADHQQFKQQMLSWANRFNICCFLDNQQYHLPHHHYECLLAAGAVEYLELSAGTAFDQLQELYEKRKDWLFGHLGYDLKNELEPLQSNHHDGVGFADLFFFVPAIVLQLKNNELHISSLQATPEQIFKEITATVINNYEEESDPVNINSRFNRQQYIDTVQKLRQHILRGDCYEINFCQEFFAEGVTIDPLAVYNALSKTSPNPFAAFYKNNDRYLLCASPERYLNKTGSHIYSQPIKGTSPRNRNNEIADAVSKNQLYNSAKDRSENVMVVDLVRNDLSKVCEEGTVQVDELFGIYSFPQVHQMISTVSGTVRNDATIATILKATFPMGSMTGAPKRRVMELVEQYERTRRGVYSGAVGYITPAGDFDFNVVIRSILYNASQRYLSFQAGSAITFYSDPEQEYEECLLKAAAIRQVLGKVGKLTAAK